MIDLQSFDPETRAYALGWLASGDMQQEVLSISTKDPFFDLLEHDSSHVAYDYTVYEFTNPASLEAIRKILYPEGTLVFPKFDREELNWAFLRGLFDTNGTISSIHSEKGLMCFLHTTSNDIKQKVCEMVPMQGEVAYNGVAFFGVDALDFLGLLYEGASLTYGENIKQYRTWATWVPSFEQDSEVHWARLHEDAVPPKKARVSDAGYDLTLIGDREKDRGKFCRLYRTGIQVSPPHGWYFDLVPRSSITKTGYMLANSVGVIDRSYRGEILVPLVKVDPEAPDLEFPIRLVQLVPRPIVHFPFVEKESLSSTSRGAGGFGSTGK